MSQVKITKDNIWHHFEYHQKFRAKCRTCGIPMNYINFRKLNYHLREHFHDIIKIVDQKLIQQEEENRRLEYFCDTLRTPRCRLCNEDVPPEDFCKHLIVEHDQSALFDYEITNNKEKYCTQEDKFKVICKVKNCIEPIHLDLEIKTIERHLNSKNHINKLKIKQTGAKQVTSFEELRKNYIIGFTYFQAICKVEQCAFEEDYVDIVKFDVHVKNKHKAIYSCEEKNEGHPWMFFKYKDEESKVMQCLLCIFNDSNKYLPIKDDLEVHFNTHSDADRSKYTEYNRTYNRNWLWKYCTKASTFEMRCSLCPSNTPTIRLNATYRNLNHHTQAHAVNESTSTKRAYDDTAGPSESQPKMTKSDSSSKGE